MVYSQWVNFTVCKLHFKKAVRKETGREGGEGQGKGER